MGSSVSRAMAGCFMPLPTQQQSTKQHSNALFLDPQNDEGLGHSFCYIRPSGPPSPLHTALPHQAPSCPQTGDCCVNGALASHQSVDDALDQVKPHPETTFKAISGASVSANTSTPCTILWHEQIETFAAVPNDRAAAFECTASFASLPLQPIPKGIIQNPSVFAGPISVPSDAAVHFGSFDGGAPSGLLERGFLSGPLERSSLFGSMDLSFDPSHFSAPLPGSYVNYIGNKRRVSGLIDVVRKPVQRVWSGNSSRMKPINLRGFDETRTKNLNDPQCKLIAPGKENETRNLQWAHGKAGEDRMHVVLSDKHGWLFVGIYDGFHGPDAPDFLMRNLYASIYKELQGLLWEEEDERTETEKHNADGDTAKKDAHLHLPKHVERTCSIVKTLHDGNHRQQTNNQTLSPGKTSFRSKWVGRPRRGMSFPSSHHLRDKDHYITFVDRFSSIYSEPHNPGRRTFHLNGSKHSAVLEALERALEATEKAYLDMVDRALSENPELALMGSCILVMLMKDEDVYIVNVGDSRAILGQRRQHIGKHRRRFSQEDLQFYSTVDCGDKSGARDCMMRMDLERIIEESPLTEKEAFEAPYLTSPTANLSLTAVQLSRDHCTSVKEEVRRIEAEHSDSDLLINDRVKGTLKLTRAFGAGFLKKPQWNSAILEMFRINYIGSAPYISCSPSLHHHRLSQNDRFLILSSDGLYQYLSNQEVVSHVEWFMEMFPEGDPAQHLVEELLFRAAKKAGMDFHQLLEVPQGDRRKYHDDVSVMVISLQGRIWRSCS